MDVFHGDLHIIKNSKHNARRVILSSQPIVTQFSNQKISAEILVGTNFYHSKIHKLLSKSVQDKYSTFTAFINRITSLQIRKLLICKILLIMAKEKLWSLEYGMVDGRVFFKLISSKSEDWFEKIEFEISKCALNKYI